MIKFCFEDGAYHRNKSFTSLSLKKCEYYTLDNKSPLRESFTSDTSLIFVADGSIEIELSGECATVHRGYGAIVSADVCRKITAKEKSAVYKIDFSCLPEVFLDSESRINLLFPESGEDLNFVRVYEKFVSGAPVERCEVILLDLLFGLLCSKKYDKSERLFDSFCKYCKEHSAEPLLVCEIASVLGCTKDHLSRIVKKSCAMTAKEYIDSLRASQASSMLRKEERSIEEIGKSLGFPTVELFNKFLKYHLGKTALDIRRSLFDMK